MDMRTEVQALLDSYREQAEQAGITFRLSKRYFETEVEDRIGITGHPVGNLIVLRTDESFPEVNGPGEINIAAVATKVGEISGMKGVPFLIANIGAERTVRARLWVPGRGEVRIRLDAIRALTELFGQEERLTISMTGGEAKTEISDGQVTITLPVTTVFGGTTVV